MNSLRKIITEGNSIIFRIIILVIVILALIVSISFTKKKPVKNFCDQNHCVDYDRIVSINLLLDSIDTTAKKVMFVAHPDDETLWGSHALYHEKYLVVCVTCGGRKDRVEEFSKVMELSEDDYIMLNYPDLVNGKKSNWEKEWDAINADIEKILNAKDWDMVVTHNPEGEYGHIHHKMTNKIVTSYANHDKLVYFGRFYWGKIPNENELYRLTDEEFDFKANTLIPEYPTQDKAIYNLRNMVHYESWITYQEWYGEESE